MLFAAGLVLVVLVVVAAGWEEVVAALGAADPRLALWAAGIYLVQLPLMGLRWWVGLRLVGHRTPFFALLRAAAGTSVVNFVAPGHFGEPLLAIWLQRRGLAPGVEAFSVLVATKVLATLLNFAVLLLCVPGLLPVAGQDLRAELGLTLLLLAVPFVAVLYTLVDATRARRLGERIVGPVAWGLRRLRRDEPMDLRERVHAGVERFRTPFQVFAGNAPALIVVSLLSLCKSACVAGAIALGYAALGRPLSLWDALFVQSVDTLGHLASIWIPGDLGVQEVILTAGTVVGLGLEPQLAAAAALFQKALLVLYVIVAAVVFVLPVGGNRVSPNAP